LERKERRSRGTPREHSTVGGITSQSAGLKNGGLALFLKENRGPQERASALIHQKQRELGKFPLRFASSKKRFEIFTRERWRLY
jgi:hypothetical protein